MDVRDAVEDDAPALAALADTPEGVMGQRVHDRTIRVATDGDEIRGFVSFDARRDAVHVTELVGDDAVCEELLSAPLAFGAREGLPVEVVVDEDEDGRQALLERAGFVTVGEGPRFQGTRTLRYRVEPE